MPKLPKQTRTEPTTSTTTGAKRQGVPADEVKSPEQAKEEEKEDGELGEEQEQEPEMSKKELILALQKLQRTVQHMHARLRQ